MTKRTRLKLRSEQLEDRQMLHGGAMGELVEPPTTADRVAAIQEQFGADAEGNILQTEVSERAWARLSAADADENGSVSTDELTSHLEARLQERAAREAAREARREATAEERAEQQAERQANRTASIVDRVFAATESSEDDNEVLDANEMSEDRWGRISVADANSDGEVTREELTDHVIASQEARDQAREERREERQNDRRNRRQQRDADPNEQPTEEPTEEQQPVQEQPAEDQQREEGRRTRGRRR